MKNNTEEIIVDWVVILVAIIFYLLLAFPIKWAWNYTMPFLFNLSEITWLHAYCLGLLSTLLLKTRLISHKFSE